MEDEVTTRYKRQNYPVERSFMSIDPVVLGSRVDIRGSLFNKA